jgi:hypothetical protein
MPTGFAETITYKGRKATQSKTVSRQQWKRVEQTLRSHGSGVIPGQPNAHNSGYTVNSPIFFPESTGAQLILYPDAAHGSLFPISGAVRGAHCDVFAFMIQRWLSLAVEEARAG